MAKASTEVIKFLMGVIKRVVYFKITIEQDEENHLGEKYESFKLLKGKGKRHTSK